MKSDSDVPPMIVGIALVVLAFLILGGVEVFLNMGSRRNTASRWPTWGEKNDPSGQPGEPYVDR